jgi:hemerythrin-like metal-binding protein
MEKDEEVLKIAKSTAVFELEPMSQSTEQKTLPDPIEWKNQYSLGIKTIDKQHQMIMRSFANIENSIHAELAWSTIHYSILELKELALRHFAVEEALMELFGYPKITEHQITHEAFLNRLEEILNISIRKSANKELLSLLEEWKTKHILGADRDYAKYILSGASVVR